MVVRNENKGAGLYGAPHQSHKTPCPQSNNPFGHNRECACGWRAGELERREMPVKRAELHEYFGNDE